MKPNVVQNLPMYPATKHEVFDVANNTIKTRININRLDTALNNFRNIPDFPTCKWQHRNKLTCVNCKSSKKCCNSCNHECRTCRGTNCSKKYCPLYTNCSYNMCYSCLVKHDKCKELSTVCCPACNHCRYCYRSKINACPFMALRDSISILVKSRNFVAHSKKQQLEELRSKCYVPTNCHHYVRAGKTFGVSSRQE